MTPEKHEKKETLDYESMAFPGEWDEATLKEKFLEFMNRLVQDTQSSLPPKRIQYQVEQSVEYEEIRKLWNKLTPTERLNGWKRLLERAEEALRNVLPTCVQCGECCRKGSPTLHLEDLELLQQGKIPWEQVYALRRGEPVRPPNQENEGRPFFLLDERIKIREHRDGKGCVFLEDGSDLCTIYSDRPIQCRAQACWDPTESRELGKGIYLTRQDIFEKVELLMQVIVEHEKRCSFEALHAAFKKLQESGERDIEAFLGLVSYEDHFRNFVSEQFHIPRQELELVLGRSFADLMPLFGLKVVEEPDGTKCLVADRSEPASQ